MIKFAGGFAGVMSWLLTHPADVVKSRIQAQERFLVRCNYFLEFQTKTNENIKSDWDTPWSVLTKHHYINLE